jgi:hypothetical protein
VWKKEEEDLMDQGLTYNVDIVLCIDSTGSMTPILDRVKQHAIDFYDDVTRTLEEKDKHIDQLRLRVVAFRDVGDKDVPPFEISDFYSLPDDQEGFAAFIRGLQPIAGGDAPESGLEAVAVAMHSDWTTEGDKRRQIIVVWTDAPSHTYGRGHENIEAQLAAQIPASLDELTDLWHDPQDGLVSVSAKRLILFAPDGEGWTTVSNNWDNVVHLPSRAGEGLRDFAPSS